MLLTPFTGHPPADQSSRPPSPAPAEAATAWPDAARSSTTPGAPHPASRRVPSGSTPSHPAVRPASARRPRRADAGRTAGCEGVDPDGTRRLAGCGAPGVVDERAASGQAVAASAGAGDGGRLDWSAGGCPVNGVKSILIVDDDSTVLDVLTRALDGYRVWCARD